MCKNQNQRKDKMRKFRKKYLKPKKPWDKSRIIEEKEIMKKYGLKNKKEIWRAEAYIKKLREIAKKLIVESEEKKREFINRLAEYGFVESNATIDDVFALDKKKILDRRLQTIVYKKGLANTIKQARQFIVHGHVFLKGNKIDVPGYLVKLDEEAFIDILPKIKKILKISIKNK